MGTETILSDNRVHYFDSHYIPHHHGEPFPVLAVDVSALFFGSVGTAISGQTEMISKVNLYIIVNSVNIPIYLLKGTNFLSLYYDTIDDDTKIITRYYVPVQEYNDKLVKQAEVQSTILSGIGSGEGTYYAVLG